MINLETMASPNQSNSSFLTLSHLKFSTTGETRPLETGDAEHVLDVLSGQCRVSCKNYLEGLVDFQSFGNRETILFYQKSNAGAGLDVLSQEPP
jgi:hypothetical protein